MTQTPVLDTFASLFAAYASSHPQRDELIALSSMSLAARKTHFADRIRELADHLDETRLFQHQKEVVEAFSDHFSDPEADARGTAIVPTAGGKTEIFTQILGALLGGDAKEVGVIPKTIILVPTRQLLDQTFDRISLGCGLDVGIWDADRCDVRNVTLVTYTMYADLCRDGRLVPDDTDILILDEAHRGLSEIRSNALNPFLERAICLAFSATPSFHDEKTVFELMGRDNTVIEVDDARLVEDGVTSPVVNYIIEVDITGTLPTSRSDRRHVLDVAGINVMKQFFDNHVDEATGLAIRDKLFLGYTSRVAKTKLVAKAFEEYGHVTPINGRDNPTYQDLVIDRLRNGRIKGIVNAALLVEGTDIPSIGCILNFDTTSSHVKEVQRCGRVRRINPQIGDRFSVEQTGFVVETYYRVNGRMIGNPVFYYDAIGDSSIARIVTTDGTQAIDDIIASPEYQALKWDSRNESDEEGDEQDFDADLMETEIDEVRIDNTADTPESPEEPALPLTARQAWSPASSYTVTHRVTDVFRRLRRGNIPRSPDDYIGLIEASRRLLVPKFDKDFRAAWNELMANMDDEGQSSLGDREVRFSRFWVTGHSACLMHEDDLHILQAHIDNPQTRYASQEWLTRFAVANLLDAGSKRIEQIWPEITRAAHEGDFLALNGKSLRVSLRRGRNDTPIGYLHADSLADFAIAFAIGKKTTLLNQKWLTLNEAVEELPFVGDLAQLRALWNDTTRRLEEGETVSLNDVDVVSAKNEPHALNIDGVIELMLAVPAPPTRYHL